MQRKHETYPLAGGASMSVEITTYSHTDAFDGEADFLSWLAHRSGSIAFDDQGPHLEIVMQAARGKRRFEMQSSAGWREIEERGLTAIVLDLASDLKDSVERNHESDD